jgi:hypothetical protein
MSSGGCIIDGIDLYTLGIFIVRGGDHDLISFPARKTPDINDWPDEDGVEPDLSAPVFEPKKVTIQYYCNGNELALKSRVDAFVNLHFVPGYRTVYIREFDKTFTLRFSGISNYKQTHGYTTPGRKGAFIDVDYWMDDPLQFFGAATVPQNGRNATTHVSISGTDLSEFGIIVRDVYTTALRLPLKTGLTTSSRWATGQVADADYMHKQVAEINIDCSMILNNRADFWNNYNALFNALTSGVLRLGLTAAQKDFSCWYKSMSEFRKKPWTDRVFAEFRLTVVAYDWNSMLYLLSTEAGEVVLTSDDYCIDLSY